MATSKVRDPDITTPGWKRSDTWPFEEDFGSPKWLRRMRLSRAKLGLRRELCGFNVCPECRVAHTAMTVSCRGCGHTAKIAFKDELEIDDIVLKALGYDESDFKYAPGKGPDDVGTRKEAPSSGVAEV